MKIKANHLTIFTYLLLAFPPPLLATSWSFDGHLKYRFDASHFAQDSITARLDADKAQDHSLDLRLKFEVKQTPWQAKLHYEALALAGDGVSFRNRFPINNTAALPNDARRLFDFSEEIHSGNHSEAVHRLDRIWLSYSRDALVLKGGRQAVSWGNGLVFNALDIFSPFSPVAIDKDYKTGDDLLYAQWLFPSGDDIQGILLPRRDLRDGQLRSAQSTVAIKYHRFQEQFDYELYAARHYDESLLGLGLSGSLLGAAWRTDLSITRLRGEQTRFSWLGNIDYSWVFHEYNFYAFLEYFYSGVGEANRYQRLNADLSARLARGELFNVGRDYLALGIRAEITPLWSNYATLLHNLNDGSGFWQLRSLYDWSDQLQLWLGLEFPYGATGSEFGGIFIPEINAFATPATRVYLRLTYFF